MSSFHSPFRRRLLVLAGLAITAGSQAGCALMSNLGHAMGADQIPPEYEGLEDCRLAVVTISDASQFSEDDVSSYLSRQVSQILTSKLKKIRLVREEEIARWRDTHGYDHVDFVEIGEGVNADKLLGIQINNLRLQDGKSLYRGKAEVEVQIIDPQAGEVLFRRSLSEFTYPETAGQHVSETTESKFQKLYLTVLAERIGRMFHPYDFSDTVALDGRIASQ